MIALLVAAPLVAIVKTYDRNGFYVLATVVFGILITGAVVELRLLLHSRKALGHYINGFVMAYPWLAGLFAIVVGAMIAHFFLGLYHKDQILPAIFHLLFPGYVE